LTDPTGAGRVGDDGTEDADKFEWFGLMPVPANEIMAPLIVVSLANALILPP
jgi:flavin reductase (DIM6/NTAB) family NADH-FMN oxidoreductase RutF